MSETVLAGQMRKAGGKGPARRLRAKGLLPGVVYGQGDNLTVSVLSKDVLKILETKGGANAVISANFEGDGKKRSVMIKELIAHPISDNLIHIDFLEIDINKPVRVTVNIEFTGVSKGVKEKGGRLSVNMHKLNIEALPNDIPASVEVPVTDLDTGESIAVKDLDTGANWRALDNPDTRVVSVAEPQAEAAPDEDGEEPAEDTPEEKKE